MDKRIAKDTGCPFCGNTFFEGNLVGVYEEDGKLVIYCPGCGYDIEVRIGEDGKVYF